MKFIIPIIVGGIIGYATNWLAIKMLFRPHYEKKIMGIKVPFTPGLIPKERLRIAKNIGETVGEYLLSPATIMEKLSSNKTNEEIYSWMENKINKLKNDNRSIGQLVEKHLGNDTENLVLTMEKSIAYMMIQEIRKDSFRSQILNFIENKINQDEIYDEIRNILERFIENTLKSNEMNMVVENSIERQIKRISADERILADVLSKDIKLELNRYLDENSDKIGNYIRRALKSPEVQNRMKKSISTMVDQNVSRLITSFITPDVISEKIFLAIEKYIEDNNSNKDINLIIKSFLNTAMESKISDLTSGILEKVSSKEISNYILSNTLNLEGQNRIINIIDEKLRNMDKDRLMENLSRELDKILESETIDIIVEKFILGLSIRFRSIPLMNIGEKIDIIFPEIYNTNKMIFHKFIQDELPKIIGKFNISKIVEGEINKFDVEFTERLILDIASKELAAITWLGALLGAIMGLLSPILQML